MVTKYQVQCMDVNIYAEEAYGEDPSPLFATATEAEQFMIKCINAWPDDAPVRADYEVHEVEAYLDEEPKNTITFVAGNSSPELVGKPFLSTTFRNGNFTKNLYTASTLEIVVGVDWTSE